MREDLNKLLCERERRGHRNSFHDARHDAMFASSRMDDCEDLPFREKIKGRYSRGYGTKSFSENLNPLYGFIRKAAGRKWDDVYAEICQVFDKRSVINQHILIHLDQHVETNPIVGVDGKLYVLNTYSNKYLAIEETGSEYYVDPRDGILKFNKDRLTTGQLNRLHAARYAAELATKYRKLNEFTTLEKRDGIWYEIKHAKRAGSRKESYICGDHPGQLFYRTIINYVDEHGELVRGIEIYGSTSDATIEIRKRQLSHKELKAHGITNDSYITNDAGRTSDSARALARSSFI